MVKAEQRMQRLSKQNSSCVSPSKSKLTAHFASTRNMIFSRRRRKRKVGVTLVSMLKKKQPPVNSLFDEAGTDASVKHKVNTVMHKNGPHSDWKCLSPSTSKSADYYTPDVTLCQNDTTDSCAQTMSSSCFSPVIIDDSSDTDRSSVDDTTNVFSTSAVSEAGNSEDADCFAEDNGRITHGLG